MPEVTPALALLADRAAILDCSSRYMRGQDRLDADLQRGAFHPGAKVDYGFFVGLADDFVTFAQDLLARYPMTWHMLGQSLIEIAGDRATGEIYFHAWHRRLSGERQEDLQIAGRYLDDYERRDGMWGISHRREIVDWTRTDPAADDWLHRTPLALLGGRSGADASQQIAHSLQPREEHHGTA
ncbi:nuclear transport factor 2 family protein [Novosphingobium sp. ERN07]|uniref:nuclear transport factor 2 family protein n=1 Tax=Novosphingobium sp. ERN07 TaxID=2726187 RepID=UPI00145712B3|nr:nuclear transport factor 2 family protein [Novosphingobium sp. ERN07]NLR73190.1 nuclear transport factor 2 family protein [Novosphingobium sp. ERN07]